MRKILNFDAIETPAESAYTHGDMQFISIILHVLQCQQPVITELAPDPLIETSGEFVEIYNPSSDPVCLSGYTITDGDALDPLLPWQESLYGTFPHSGMLLETDTLPPGGFALVFELDYAAEPCYDIPAGTLILTTGDHSICNGLAASSDPLTLFDPGGTADSNAVSTYGTPVSSDIWQDRDDDGLDGIPFDPGENITVERYPWSAPDQETSWYPGPVGGTPGEMAQPPPDTLNISCDSIWTVPQEPDSGEIFQINAKFSCWGNTSPSSGSIIIFLDLQGDSIAGPGEILATFSPTGLQPGTSQAFTAQTSLPTGWYLPSALADVPEDEYRQDDFRNTPTAVSGGIDPVVTEVMCNPLDEDTGEYIEIYYPGPGIFPITGCRFTDGDAVDLITAWSQDPLTDPDAYYSNYIIQGIYGIVIDPEYAGSMEEYDLAESTLVLTVENTTIGNGLSGTDPITLYDFSGTTQDDVLSTYGTPLKYDDPLLCDDDGLDGIPFDPGEYHSVERKSSALPDDEYCWAVSPEGGTPGGPAVFEDSTDASVDSLILIPQQPQPGQPLQLASLVSNRGTVTARGIEVTIYIDSNADSLPQPNEILLATVIDSLGPGGTDTVAVSVSAPPEGYYLAAAGVHLEGDMIPENDITLNSFRTGQGVPLAVTEVMCNPVSEDNDEFIEVYYPGPGVFTITGCTFTDGDALDEIVPWDTTAGTINDPDIKITPYITEGSYAVILDSEYPQGTQPYDFPQGTVVFTTANTTLGDGISGNDPITLYDPDSTAGANVMSTYGTPIDSDDPLQRDDDGLDEIPFDPGEGLSVQRKTAQLPDQQDSWFAPTTGPTPGAPAPFIQEGQNACGVFIDCLPPMGAPQQTDLLATFTNSGTDTIQSDHMTIDFYADIDQSGTPAPGELIDSYICGALPPGDTLTASCHWNSSEGGMELFALAHCPQDSFPQDDTLKTTWNQPGPLIINEIMYCPSPGQPEWIEILNNSDDPVQLCDWTVEDSKDRVVFCQDSITIQPDSFAVIVSDSNAFREVWQNVECPLLQPPSWPVLNNTTQSGEEYADIITLRNSSFTPSDYVPYDDDWGASQGGSLEKIDSNLPGWEAQSWTGCPDGGTPGSPNSCTAGGGESGRYLYCFPDPFSPDNDGTDDILNIEMHFQHPENEVTLEVYNVQGRLIRKLLNNETCGSSRTVQWNGTGDNSQRLPVGRYIIYLTSRSTDSGEYREDCTVVILARHL